MPEVSLNNLRKQRPGGTRLDVAAWRTRTVGLRRPPGDGPAPSVRGLSGELGLLVARGRAACRKRSLAAVGALVMLCVFGLLPALRAQDVSASASSRTPTVAVSAVTHITDAQNRLMSGKLKPIAEARSRANALYAEAMLLSEDSTGDQQQALDLLRQVVALDPSFIEAQVKLANILLQSGRLDQALAALRIAAAAHPDSIPIQITLGYTQRLRGQNDEAFRLCIRALSRDPTQILAMRVVLEIAAEQDDLAGGVLHIEDVLKTGGSRVPASAWLDLARLYLEVAQSGPVPPAGAVILNIRLPILQQAAAKPPPEVKTLLLLADTYRDLGRKTDMLKTLRRARVLEPSDVDLVLRCADLEFDLGQAADEIKDYETAYALNPVLPGLRKKLGNLYLDHQRYEDAIRLFKEALGASQNPGLEIDLGLAYEQAHQPEKAQACFQRVFDSVACPPEAYLKLAVFQFEHQEVKEAGATLASAQARFPQSAQVRFYEAVQHQYEKNYDAALACLAEVRVLATGAEAAALDPDCYRESVLVLSLAGKKDQLEAVLREALAKYPGNPEWMNELAYFWADQGRHLPDALALSRRAVALDPDNGAILDTLGWTYFQLDQAKDALPYLQRAAVLTNNDPVVLQHMGDAYSRLGLRRDAIATWRRALERDPRNGGLAHRIDAALAQAKNAHLRSAPNP